MNTKLKKICAFQILDSRGVPTIKTVVETKSGIKACASIPSGASVGSREALELRDGNNNFYFGKGVLGAVNNVNEKIFPALINKSVLGQKLIDEVLIELDNTENKTNLGANAILSVSLACARCASLALNIPLYEYLGGIQADTLPVPMVNIINGGAHADNSLDFQEFMITPIGACSFSYGLQMVSEVFYSLKNLLKKKGHITSVGDEGGFAPNLKSNKEAIDLILEAISISGYSTDEIKICLDIASSEFYFDKKYNLKSEGLILNSSDMAEYLKRLVEEYPIVSMEDGMAQDDYEGWRKLSDEIKNDCLLVGDDLFVTNSKLLAEGIKEKIANAILIKLNQIGTLTETLDTVRLAKRGGYKTIISHRSGETEDDFIADLAVGVNSGLIKTGSISRGERISKYNRLLCIEAELNEKSDSKFSKYMGINAYFDDFGSSFCKGGCNRRM